MHLPQMHDNLTMSWLLPSALFMLSSWEKITLKVVFWQGLWNPLWVILCGETSLDCMTFGRLCMRGKSAVFWRTEQ